ncbi:MAG: hypothetical protein HZB51_00940 [Chloroflexi bacterium]|nr:hypothetical protein [Chloroflexota bacterium]
MFCPQLIGLLDTHLDKRYRHIALHTALACELITPDELKELERRYGNPMNDATKRTRGRRRFSPKGQSIGYAWARKAEQGIEFWGEISSKDARDHWMQVIRWVGSKGMLAIRYHKRILGIIASPQILVDVLRDWRTPAEPRHHVDLEIWLNQLLPHLISKQFEGFHPQRLALSAQPKSIARLIGDLEVQGGVALVQRYREACALVVPVIVLAALRSENDAQTTWGQLALSWIAEVAVTTESVTTDEADEIARDE